MDTLEKLGKYEIKRVLGRGAMGVVYEGWDPTIQRIVAIKTVPITDSDDAETQEAIARFRREAQAAGRLTHPNIVSVFDYGETDELAYIVMEYVNGPSLKDLMGKNDRFALPDVVKIMQDVLAGLEHSHEQGVVHRDIKPANLMLTSRDRARARIKISDFGIARIESSSMTQAGVMMGTPTYMSPEQFMGQTVDPRTDLYSCGVLLYQMLTGERPFEGGLSAIMHKVLNTEPIAPSQLSVNVTPPLDAVVKRAMAKRPAERFQTAHEFAEALVAAVRAPGRGPSLNTLAAEESTMVARPDAVAAAAAEMDSTMAMASLETMPPTPAANPPPGPLSEGTVIAPALPAEPARGSSKVPMIAGAVIALVAVGGGGAFFLLRQTAPLPTPPPVSAPPVSAPPVSAPPVSAPPVSAPPVSAPTASAPPPAVVTPAQPDQGQTSRGQTSQGQINQGQTNQGQPATARPAPPMEAAKPVEPAPPRDVAAEKPPAVMPAPAAPPAAATPDVAAIRDRFVQIVAGQSCALLNGSVSDRGTVTLTGIAGPGVRDDVRDALAGATIPVLWRTTSAESVFCQPLDVLRPIATPFAATEPRLALSLADDRSALHDGQRIRPRIVMPNFPGYLRVDYVTHDGAVQHLYPQLGDQSGVVADKVRVLQAGERVALGDPPPGQPSWEVGPPYGTDMIIAIASAQPLFSKPRPSNVEKADTYLHDLAASVRNLERAGGRIIGNAMLVDTLPK